MAGTLYLVPTPIGNLEDASPRCRRVLAEVDIIAAEDTRTAKHLLDLFGISGARIQSYFEGNEAARTEQLVDELHSGKNVAVISEAGTPCVSDPGQRLVSACAEAGIAIVCLPGPSAVTTALVASGLPTQPFSFFGFLPREAGPRQLALGALRQREETMVFYESPERVGACLADMREAFGDERRVVLARELSKVYEEYVRGSCAELAETYAEVRPRGECTLVVEGAPESAETFDLDAAIRTLLRDGLGPKDVAARLMIKSGKPRREIYQLALSLKREIDG